MTLATPAQSQTWTYVDGDWHEGNVAVVGPRSHAFWLGSSVFDGARWFEGVAPDLELHCKRVNASAIALGLKPTMTPEEIVGLTWDGLEEVRRQDGGLYPADVLGRARQLYGRAGRSGVDALLPVPLRGADDPADRLFHHSFALSPALAGNDADQRQGWLPLSRTTAARSWRPRCAASTMRWCSTCWAMSPKPGRPTSSWSRTARCSRRPPTARFCPASPGRARWRCWRTAGFKTTEKTLSVREFREADEIFSTGNHSKVVPVTRIEDRDLQPGPIAKRARELYWDWAHSTKAD